MRSGQKKERRAQGRSENADQGVQMNSTWPTLPANPFGSVAGALPSTASLAFKGLSAQVGRFLGSRT